MIPMSSPISRNANFLLKLVNACAVAALALGYNAWAQRAQANDAQVREEMTQAQRAGEGRGPYATDGVFTGTAQGYGGPVTTQVTIEGGYITAVEVTDHSGETSAYFSQAETLTQKIVEAQTTDVDTVSGATFSSAGILNGATEALLQSGSTSEGGE